MKHYLMGQVKAIAGEDPNGEFEVILSAPTLDRDGEIIDAKAFEPLPEHITFDIDHGMSTATTVGSGTPFYGEDGALRVRGTFSSIARAQEVRTLVNEGHIRTTSVAFMDAKRVQSKDGVTHIVSAELLNGAFVAIPSNREAVVLMSKSLNTGPVRKGHGFSATNLRAILQDALSSAVDSSAWPWLRDYSDDWIVFELWDGSRSVVYQQCYEISGNVATLTGDPIEVVAMVQYEPITEDSTDAPAPPANSAGKPDEAPADEAGKAPASEVVEARLLLATASVALHG